MLVCAHRENRRVKKEKRNGKETKKGMTRLCYAGGFLEERREERLELEVSLCNKFLFLIAAAGVW